MTSITCFVTAMGIFICTELPINLDCLDNVLSQKTDESLKIFGNKIDVSSCIMKSKGCCAWMGGVAYYDAANDVFMCNDGRESPSCGGAKG